MKQAIAYLLAAWSFWAAHILINAGHTFALLLPVATICAVVGGRKWQ